MAGAAAGGAAGAAAGQVAAAAAGEVVSLRAECGRMDAQLGALSAQLAAGEAARDAEQCAAPPRPSTSGCSQRGLSLPWTAVTLPAMHQYQAVCSVCGGGSPVGCCSSCSCTLRRLQALILRAAMPAPAPRMAPG